MNNLGQIIYRRKILILVILLLVLLVSFMFSRTILIVSIDESQEAAVQVIKNQDPGAEVSIKNGLNILGPGSYTVKAHTADSETRLSIDAKPLRINRATLKLLPQKSSEKVAREAGDCPIGNPANMKTGDVLSYNCTNPLHIFKNSFADIPKKETLVSDVNLLFPTPHLDGVVHFLAGADSADKIVEFINSGGKRTVARYSNDFSPNHYSAKSQNDKLYILNPGKKQLDIYSGQSFSKQTLELGIPDGDWSVENISFDARDNKLFVLSAKPIESSSLEPEYSGGVLWSFDIAAAGGKLNPTSTHKVDQKDIEAMRDFAAIDSSHVATRSLDDTAIIYALEGKGLKVIDKFTGTSDWAIAQGALHVLIKGNIYSYVPADHSLYLAFDSTKFTVSGLRPLNNELLFNAFSENESEPTNQTYILGHDSVSPGKRIENILPYGDLELPIRWMDYKGDKIYVKLLLNSIGFQRNGQVLFDQQEFDNKKKAVSDQLATDGFTPTKYKINFTY